MSTMHDIEKLTKEYSGARGELAGHVGSLEAELESVKRRRLSAIKRLLAEASEAEVKLRAALEESPEIFKRPKTQIFYGIRVGYQKAKGTITFGNPDAVIRLIKKHFPEQAEILIRTVETPNKQSLSELPAGDLKKLGCEVVETGEVVVVKPVDGEVEKLVNALLKDATGEIEAA